MNLEQHILRTIYQKKPAKPIKVLFPEAENEKIQTVAQKIMTSEFFFQSADGSTKMIKIKELIEPVLLFSEHETIPEAIKKEITFLQTTDQPALAQALYEIRKAKGLTLKEAEEMVANKNYYAMMLLATDAVDCLVGGINYNSSDILRPALQIIKAHQKTVSSTFIMNKEQTTYFFSDCSINITPTAEQLVEIASSTIDFVLNGDFKTFDPSNFSQLNVAMLSYSTNGSGRGEDVEKVKKATQLLVTKWKSNNNVNIIGEIQFDAAYDETVRKKKFLNANIQGSCNIFIFPSLEAGNIGYKIAQRLGAFKAIGPIILGLNKPVNDLSRGSTVTDIYDTTLITCVQKLLKI